MTGNKVLQALDKIEPFSKVSCYNSFMAQPWIGCSGFNYREWKETFYPRNLPQRRWFEYYSTIFSTVELNVTFYRLPLKTTFIKWRDQTPPGFAFSLKGSRYITHLKRLKEVEEPLERFFERALQLKGKLKVVLWQFPPGFKIDLERLALFLKNLGKYPIRNTLEFRHGSWINPEVIGLYQGHNINLCMADWPDFIGDLPVTSDFIYIRRHGVRGSYASDYSPEALKKDARRITGYIQERKDVFIYFNNDAYGYAPKNARELMELIREKERRLFRI
jgi:uncharacterized protein YecE (DUF72 family)